jgi:hypothetical protein
VGRKGVSKDVDAWSDSSSSSPSASSPTRASRKRKGSLYQVSAAGNSEMVIRDQWHRKEGLEVFEA